MVRILTVLLLLCAVCPLSAFASDGFVVLRADELTAPFHNPIDLAGRSIALTLQGDGTYAVANLPLQFDADLGTPVTLVGASTGRVTLTRFAFPFFGSALTEFTVTREGAIYPGTPPVPTVPQYDAVEALVQHAEPVIAPLLMRVPAGVMTVHLKELDDRALLTWSLDGPRPLRMQAALFSNGNILFSYENVHPETLGVMIVSRGLASLPKNAIATFTDPADDTTSSASPALAPALDLLSASFSRIADLDLIEIRLTMKAPLDPATVPKDRLVNWELDFGGAKIKFDAAGGVTGVQYPVRGVAFPSSRAVTFANGVLTFLVDEDWLGAGPVTIRTSASNRPTPVDELTFTANLGKGARTAELNLATARGSRHADMIVEAFTLPNLDLEAAWAQLKKRYGLRDEDVDGVAMYQNFNTNLRAFARAYSTVGNAGADGIWSNGNSSSARPKTPALLHMNSLEQHGTLSTQNLLLHEFGHRWLMLIEFMDGDVRNPSLASGGAHPSIFANMPSATTTGPTPMNGERWNDNGDGTFTRVPGPVGYSWLDLYLMGLAAPSEVPQMFYVEGAQSMGSNGLRGTRKNVSIEQIIAAMGPRFPAYPQAQKKFNMLFVLVVDDVPTDAELAAMTVNATSFPQTFRNATAGRGEIVLLEPEKPKRRAARH